MFINDNCLSWLLILIFFFVQGSAGECEPRYIKEPISNITCNPYLSESILQLQCDLQVRPSTVKTDFQILWFFSRDGQSSVKISDSASLPVKFVKSTQVAVDEVLISSTIVFNASFLNSSTHGGSYYCHAALDGNYESYASSNTFILRNELSYQGFQPCTGIQSSTVNRCANMGTSITASFTTDTRSFGFNLREVEEDLEIGFFVLALFIVMAIGIGTVSCIAFMGKKCDKNKQLPLVHVRSASFQNNSEDAEVHINTLDSSGSSGGNTKDIALKQVANVDGPLTSSTKCHDSHSVESDDYVSVGGDQGFSESVIGKNTKTNESELKGGGKAFEAIKASPQTDARYSNVFKLEKNAADTIYEDLPGLLPTGDVNPIAEETLQSSKAPPVPPKLPPKNSLPVPTVNGSEKKQKDPIIEPSKSQMKSKSKSNMTSMQAKSIEDANSASSTTQDRSSQDYDSIPPKLSINDAYGVYTKENKSAAQNTENIYDSIDDKAIHEDIYEDMK